MLIELTNHTKKCGKESWCSCWKQHTACLMDKLGSLGTGNEKMQLYKKLQDNGLIRKEVYILAKVPF